MTMTKLKITSFGTSAGIELLPCGGEFEAQMAIAEEVMAENYELLSKLAK
jgi:hypothetical protein